MLENKKIVFEKPGEARLRREALDDGAVPAGEALLKKVYSIVSTGTELACLSGNEGWFSLPGVPGYSCVAEVVKTGAGVKDVVPGDRVFCYGNHTLYESVPVSGIFLRVPPEMDSRWVPFVRMASIAATAVRASNIEWGDYVAVTGQGLVGNMAMQLAKLQGAEVIAVDVADSRLFVSEKCGADLVINAAKEDVAEKIKSFTRGEMVSTLIEATGVPQSAEKAVEWIGQNGEMIFLGSPRGKYETDITPFLNKIHLAGFNVTLKGAHEWRYPVVKTPFVKHSLERNSERIIDLMRRKKLVLEPLLTEVAAPDDCFNVYNNLKNNKETYMGILFDWTT
ncbi:MAG: zinc-binding alcohol dehydrogenase [Spirochaetaceae bacterium]|jgi:2-desacetyl-2-hydroxyethyl bacteriochlorophyllide A dehydrogenase|nr:zinc-binding alcohol dehydrogenase [Spirochaetaceae bacterium]